MTQITYNNITIRDVLTHSVDQDIVYDIDGQVDQWYVKTTITVKFTFHTIDGAGLGYANGQDLAGSVSQALKALMTNRRRFVMTIGGSTLFDIRPGATVDGIVVAGGQKSDINNGPRPSLKIEEIIGTRVARGTFTIELAVPSCDGYSDDTITPINLRWWTADEVDANMYTTRTIHGRIRTATKNNNPHYFRHLVFPPLQKGFKRESMSFTEAPNGLELGFTIKDVEKFRSAPSPATSWHGNHRMVSQVPGATIVESECTVTLEGAHDTPQTQLIALGVRIIDQKLLFKKLKIGTSDSQAKAQIIYYAIDAPLHENSATVTARIRHTGSGGIAFLPQSKELGEALPTDVSLVKAYDPLVWRLLPGPTAPLTTILRSKLQTPCNPAKMPGAGDGTPGGTESTGEDGGEFPVFTGDLPTEQKDPGLSEEHLEQAYTYYSMRIEDFQLTGRARMETATASSSSQDDVLIVDLTRGRASRTIWVTAKRIGEAPTILDPKKEFSDENGVVHVLFHSSVSQRGATVIDANGTQEFSVTQKLRYELKNDPNIAEFGTVVPLLPWLKPEKQNSKLPPKIFKINPAGGA